MYALSIVNLNDLELEPISAREVVNPVMGGNGSKWVQIIRNGFKLPEIKNESRLSVMGQEWIRNRSRLPEMGQELIRNT